MHPLCLRQSSCPPWLSSLATAGRDLRGARFPLVRPLDPRPPWALTPGRHEVAPAEAAPLTCLPLEDASGYPGPAVTRQRVDLCRTSWPHPHGLSSSPLISCCVTLGKALPSLCLI